METRQLKYFLDVANCLNFTKAAQKNHIAQTAMSQNIISLENQLGFKLFERNNRNVSLTHMGEVFYQDALNIVRCVERAEIHMKHIASGCEGIIRIGIQGEHESHFLPRLVQRFRAAYPGVKIELMQGISGRLEQMLEDGDADVIFNVQYQSTSENVEEWQVDTQPLCLVAPRQHRLARCRSIDRSMLADEPMLFLNPACSESIYQYMIHDSLKSGFIPNVVGYANSIHALLLMVQCGLGISVQPKSCDLGRHDLAFIPLENEPLLNIVARWRRDNENPPMPSFLSILEEVFPCGEP